METLKHKKVQILVANAMIFATLAISCSTYISADKKNTGGRYSVEKFKTKSGHTIITGQFYDDVTTNQKLPAGLAINGVTYQTDSGDFKFIVLPGYYELGGVFVGKKWTYSKMQIHKGDSVFVKFYLTDDNSPLYGK